MKFKEIANKITGISCPFFGVSWNPPEPERNIAKRVITYLEDKRVLFSPYQLEVPEHCVSSIIDIRKFLTQEISSIKSEIEIEKDLRALRAASRKFLDKTQMFKDKVGYGIDRFDNVRAWSFLSGLGELRGVFGIHIAKIAVSYGVDVEEELATIIPESDKE